MSALSPVERAVLRLHVAANRIAALDIDLAALTELRDAFTVQSRVDVLRESGVVPLLMQSLVFSGDTVADADSTVAKTNAVAATDRINMSINLFAYMIWFTGGRELLAESGVIASFLAVLRRHGLAQQLCVVTTLFDLVSGVARKTAIAAPERLAALAHVFAHMCEVDQLQQPPEEPLSEMARYGDDYHRALGKLLATFLMSTAPTATTNSLTDNKSATQLSYTTLSAFIPLLRNIIRRHLLPRRLSLAVFVPIYQALHCVFKRDSDDNVASARCDTDGGCAVIGADRDAMRCEALADFAASEEFDPLLTRLADHDILQHFASFLDLFDDTAFERAFTPQRIEQVLTSFREIKMRDLETAVWFMAVSAPLASRFPAFALEIASLDGFARVLRCLNDDFCGSLLSNDVTLAVNSVRVFDSVLSAATDRLYAAQQLLADGAVRLCCNFLRNFAVANCDRDAIARQNTDYPSNIEHITRLLRVLRIMMMSFIDTSSGTVMRGSGPASQNPVAVEFVACRGPQALDLLRFDDCVQGDNAGPISHEMAQLRALLASLDLLAPDTPATEALRLQTLADLRTCTGSPQPDWKAVLDAHAALILEAGGYPRRLAFDSGSKAFRPRPSVSQQLRIHSGAPPSPAALAVLRARARELVLVHTRAKVSAWHVASNVLMAMYLPRSAAHPQ